VRHVADLDCDRAIYHAPGCCYFLVRRWRGRWHGAPTNPDHPDYEALSVSDQASCAAAVIALERSVRAIGQAARS
jgi:hypothetical protein